MRVDKGVTLGSIFWWLGYLAGMVTHPEGGEYQSFVATLRKDLQACEYLGLALEGLQRALAEAREEKVR